MPAMATMERLWCRSLPWRAITGEVVLPWALRGTDLAGEVLEIGSGAGANAAELLRRHPRMTLTATDVDPVMVAAARDRLAEFGDRVSVQEADATDLPFAEGRFDAVVSMIMLHHVIEWEKAMSEIARVLRPGGLLAGYDMVDSVLCRAVHRLDRSPHRLVPAAALDARLRADGFTDVRVDPALASNVARFTARKA
jgi:SAM-dependent methyltransferase